MYICSTTFVNLHVERKGQKVDQHNIIMSTMSILKLTTYVTKHFGQFMNVVMRLDLFLEHSHG